MFLVEILLPAEHDSQSIRASLTEKFGGLTAFSRSPAEGRWKKKDEVEKDEIIVLEIMADDIDTEGWKDFRLRLEKFSGEERIVIRYHEIRRL
jgi:hypothetical protein